MEEGQKGKARREASVKERGKKGEEKRDDVLPKPRATYGALAARLLITRPSLFPPSFSLFLFVSFSSSFGSIAFSLDSESFVLGLFALNSVAESLLDSVSSPQRRKYSGALNERMNESGGRRLRQGQRGKQMSNEGGSLRDKRAPRVRERKRKGERGRERERDKFERFDERDRSLGRATETTSVMAGGTGGWKQDPGQ